jgi:D-alanyl-lipoteichoic acid acyltransferase DltB (MBOAT superfamily)
VLFNSYIFIFAFLPITLIGFFVFAIAGRRLAAAWLAVMSLVFYGWWSPRYIPLLGASIAFNYLMARSIGRASSDRRRRTLLTVGICGDLLLLVYYTDGLCPLGLMAGDKKDPPRVLCRIVA